MNPVRRSSARLRAPRAATARHGERGLTLVELLVVVTILVILATVAVTATEGLVEESRRDATTATLRAIEEGILGDADERLPGGAPWVRGFVADVGRLPAVTTDPDPALRLGELWLRPAAVAATALMVPRTADLSAVIDGDVQVVCGWRGPYVRLPLGAAALRDGWGRAFEIAAADGTSASAGTSVAIVRSLGADGVTGGTAPYDGDVEIALVRTVAPAVPARHTGHLAGTVTPQAGGAALTVVRLYGPIDGALREVAAPVVLNSASGTQSFSFADVTVGPRVLRAYQTATAPAREAVFPAAVTHRSDVTHVSVVPGGVSGLSLVLR